MDYDLYHDESKVDGYWHGILLVPQVNRQKLFGLLEEARRNFRFYDPITFKGLKSKRKKFYLIKSWLSISSIAFIQVRKNQTMPYNSGKIIFSSNRRSIEIKNYTSVIGCKFILFRIINDHNEFDDLWLSDYASKVETSLRIGIKGGIHFLGDQNNPITINSLHLDGYEHYKRKVDINRVFHRMFDLRDYCSIADNVSIDDRSGNHTKDNCQEYIDCQFLQLTDLLIGAFRTILGKSTNDFQYEAAGQIKHLLDRWYEGPARMRNSRWYKGFALSQANLHNGNWEYSPFIKPNLIDNFELFN